MITAYFDGASGKYDPNGSILGVGAVVYRNGKEVASVAKHADKLGNNMVAEWLGLIAVLQMLYDLKLHEENVAIYGDNQTVIEQINGNYKTRGYLVPYRDLAQDILTEFKNYSIEWLPREENTAADMLSKFGRASFFL